MLNKSMFDKELTFIRIAHRGQVYNQKPYWHHPVRVALRLKSFMEGNNPFPIKAALLHDVIEDTGATAHDLEILGFDLYAVAIVKTISHDPVQETYAQYIQRIIETKNIGTMCVKLADLYENSNNIRFIPAEKRGRMVRYGKAIEELHEAISIVCRNTQIVFPDIISGELNKDEVEAWIGEPTSFL